MSTPHNIGALALVEVGCVIFHKDRALDLDVAPRGGMVVDIQHIELDEETGALHVRVFVVVDPYTLAERRVREEDVDVALIEPPYSPNMVKLYRRLMRENCVTPLVGPQGKRPGKYQDRAGGEFTSHDARRHDHATRLRGALMPRMP